MDSGDTCTKEGIERKSLSYSHVHTCTFVWMHTNRPILLNFSSGGFHSESLTLNSDDCHLVQHWCSSPTSPKLSAQFPDQYGQAYLTSSLAGQRKQMPFPKALLLFDRFEFLVVKRRTPRTPKCSAREMCQKRKEKKGTEQQSKSAGLSHAFLVFAMLLLPAGTLSTALKLRMLLERGISFLGDSLQIYRAVLWLYMWLPMLWRAFPFGICYYIFSFPWLLGKGREVCGFPS